MKKLAENFEKSFENCEDFSSRDFFAFNAKGKVWFLENICNKELLSKEIIEPLLRLKTKQKPSYENIKANIFIAQTKKLTTLKTAILSLTQGNCIMFFENFNYFVEISLPLFPTRAVSEPPSNNVVRGPRGGFVEDYKTNLSLVRARLATEKLKVEKFQVGELTKTNILVLSLSGITDKNILKEIIEKIKQIKIDGIIDSYYIQNYLSKHPKSIFKQCGITERPDIIVAKMLEGRVAIIVDGSPFVLTLPFILFEDFQSCEDYYEENKKVVFMRSLRIVGVFMAILMPGIYIGFQVFHYKALPLKFLVTILNASTAIPLTPLAEILLVFVLFEVLFEASIRIPKGLGSSFNIIGAIILGDTAIQSSLASAPTVMIVAVSSIALYLIPDQTSVLRILRLALTIIAGVMGIVGLVVGIMFITAYLCDFDSYGAVYLGPFTPYIKSDLKDGIKKRNLHDMQVLPKSIPNSKRERVNEK